MKHSPYRSLALVVGIHFFIMYALTYVMVNAFEDIFLNINRFYMAGIMVVPMVILMLIFMSTMFENIGANIALYITSTLLFVLFFAGIRTQGFVDNESFLKSMIPHHSSAIVMCEKSQISDQETEDLCDTIVQTQQEEINQMKKILTRLERER